MEIQQRKRTKCSKRPLDGTIIGITIPKLSKGRNPIWSKWWCPEGAGHDFHVHPEMHEILYILKGRAEQWIEDEMQVLEVGDSVYIDADVGHATFNAGEGELEFLAMLSPPRVGKRVPWI